MKQTNLILLLLTSILMVGCSEFPLSESKVPEKRLLKPTKFDLLQGDWVVAKDTNTESETWISLIVIGDRMSLFSPLRDSVKYKINGDTLTVFDTPLYLNLGEPQDYLILNLTEDNLTLKVNNDSVSKLLELMEISGDTLSFSKLHKKNNVVPESIEFSSTGCFGNCPSMLLKIKKDLSFQFVGGVYSGKDGGYSGKISRNLYTFLLKRLNQIPLSSLNTNYEAGWTDDQTRYLVITTTDKVMKTRVYGSYEEPIELTILLNSLMEVYRGLELMPNEKVVDSLFDSFLEIDHWESFPPPLPPPPPLKKD